MQSRHRVLRRLTNIALCPSRDFEWRAPTGESVVRGSVVTQKAEEVVRELQESALEGDDQVEGVAVGRVVVVLEEDEEEDFMELRFRYKGRCGGGFNVSTHFSVRGTGDV